MEYPFKNGIQKLMLVPMDIEWYCLRDICGLGFSRFEPAFMSSLDADRALGGDRHCGDVGRHLFPEMWTALRKLIKYVDELI